MFVEGRREASKDLLEAQERLSELREVVRLESGKSAPPPLAHGRSTTSKAEKATSDRSSFLPEHLGWGSEPLAKILRAAQGCKTPEPRELTPLPKAPIIADRPASRHVKLYPDIALALLREQLVAPGRLWLLLRHLDTAGRGWIEINAAREQLTKKRSALRAFGWRQMRKLLARGQGLFWFRDGRRLWLRSPLKVAATLGVAHLGGKPVALPVNTLLQSIGFVRAHFYASFHSGRNIKAGRTARPAPISRATLQALCQTSRRTLRQYEKRVGVETQRNFAIGEPLSVTDIQNQAWNRGRAVLRFQDKTGQIGRKGASYTAWQLPNSYSGPHREQPKGRQKRMNRKLADLFVKGMTGNGKQAAQSHQVPDAGARRFYQNGKTATINYGRHLDQDIYWQNRHSKKTDYQLWHWLPPQRSEWRPVAERRLRVIGWQKEH